MNTTIARLLAALAMTHTAALAAEAPALWGQSPIPEPYPYVAAGGLTGTAVPESPDPLVAYRWPAPTATDGLEIYVIKPKFVRAEPAANFDQPESLTGDNPQVVVKEGGGSIRLDFGHENAMWVEFDSPDCPGDVTMSISETNEPEPSKTKAPTKHGNTYRLELNAELYEGVRFAWIHIKPSARPWHLTGLRGVCQVKPANYQGSFSCSDPVLTRTWYLSAYSVRSALCKDYFGAILMDRGDRISWTGDAHPSQAAALVAFANYDFIKKNLENTAKQDNGIRSYALYWVLSLLDYYHYTGDAATLDGFLANACGKLDAAYQVFETEPKLRFYGWDERLCAGFEIWFRACAEAQHAYRMLSIRAWRDFAMAMAQRGRTDLRDKYLGYATEKMNELRSNPAWHAEFGLHAATDAVSTGLLNAAEQDQLFQREFRDRVNRLSISPFNQYFVIQALARLGKHDEALNTVRDMWGGMLAYGATTTFEVYRPSWNDVIGNNDPVPNSQSGKVSLCHPWGAGPVKWLNEEVLGIVPTAPGFATYDIRPHLGRTLTQVAGKTPTPHGEISASFDVAAGKCLVSAPAGTLGRVGIPKVEKRIARILINGTLAWDGAYHTVPGLGSAEEDAEFVSFTDVVPGNYEFAVAYEGTTPSYAEPPNIYPARFVKQDTTTSGNWGGVYGTDGYALCNYNGDGTDLKSLPAYVTRLDYFRAFPKQGMPDPTTWQTGTSDPRAPAADAGNPAQRNAACLSNSDQTMTVTIGINGTRDYQVALYFMDWDRRGRRQAVEMFDAESLKLIAPVKLVNDFAGGHYLVYSYDKSAKFRINKVRGDTVTLSGIFFDPKPNSAKTKNG